LFLGPDATAPDELERPPETLVVIDGTWSQARKMIALNPALRALPRIGFMPRRPGNYRIRREPARHCVATVEAVVEVLALLERDEARFAPLLRAFEWMVDRQIAAVGNRIGPPRRRLRPADPWWENSLVPDLEGMWPCLVAVAGEANAHHRGSGVPGEPELIHLAAVRLATGEVFNRFLVPRRELAPRAADHLDVPREMLLGGDGVEAVLGEWRRFFGPEDRLVGWGGFAWELLAREGWHPAHPPIDLRLVAAHRLKRRPGSVEAAARAVGAVPGGTLRPPGRGGRTVEAIAALTTALREELGAGSAPPRKSFSIIQLHG